MEELPRQGRGLLDSLSTFGGSLLAIAQTRLQLLSTELEEDRQHLFVLIILALVTLFCVGVGVVLATILLVLAFWDSHRLLVLGIVAGVYLCAGALACTIALRKLRRKPRLLAQSLAELAKDREQLRARR
jgi:uncharacterized membrane protein YqjE